MRVRDMRERLGIPEYDATKVDVPMISLMKAAEKLGICVGSAKSLVQREFYLQRKSFPAHRGWFPSKHYPRKPSG
ncbi:hypothetical protein ACOJBM_01690 [Rhizobium beringeri]